MGVVLYNSAYFEVLTVRGIGRSVNVQSSYNGVPLHAYQKNKNLFSDRQESWTPSHVEHWSGDLSGPVALFYAALCAPHRQ